MEWRCFVKGSLWGAEILLSKTVSSLWDGAESDSILKAKLFYCCWRVPSAYGNKLILYQLIFGDGGKSRECLPHLESHDHLCLPLRPMATSVHSLLWHAEPLFFWRGMEAMPQLVRTGKIQALSSLSALKRGSLKSRQLIWKSPGNQDHSHISPACRHAFTCWQALITSSQEWLFWIDCKAIHLKNTKGLLWTYFSPGRTTGLVNTVPPVPPSHNHASCTLHGSLEGVSDCLL